MRSLVESGKCGSPQIGSQNASRGARGTKYSRFKARVDVNAQRPARKVVQYRSSKPLKSTGVLARVAISAGECKGCRGLEAAREGG